MGSFLTGAERFLFRIKVLLVRMTRLFLDYKYDWELPDMLLFYSALISRSIMLASISSPSNISPFDTNISDKVTLTSSLKGY